MRKSDWVRLPQFIHRVTKRDGFWWIAGAVVILTVGIAFSWLFWEELRGDEESLSSTIRNLGLVGGGIIAIVLAVWRSLVAQKQAEAALQQASTALRQAETAQQGLLNDRYQKGAEMLGNDVLSVRLGGIYALQRLAEEHPEQYHIQIMRLFCAFVRHPTKYDGAKTDEGQIGAKPGSEENQCGSTPRLREDVQAVMQAIATRSTTGIALELEADFRLDFSHADLQELELWSGDLSLANFKNADLSGAKFVGTNLSEVYFIDVKSPAWMGNVNMSGAHFMRIENFAKMTIGGYLNVSGARFSDLDVSGMRLMGMKNLTQSQLDQCRADSNNPPRIGGLIDPETNERLVWRNY